MNQQVDNAIGGVEIMAPSSESQTYTLPESGCLLDYAEGYRQGWQAARTQPAPVAGDVERVAMAIDPMLTNYDATSEEHQYYVRPIAQAAIAALPATSVVGDVPQAVLDNAISAYAKANEAGRCPDHCVYEAVKSALIAAGVINGGGK